MTFFASLLAVLTIAFPEAGRNLPAVSRCYMIGAVRRGETNVVVNGANVPVWRTGAWATLVDVTPGTNVVEVAGSNHWFVVAAPPTPKPGETPPPPKVYGKLHYAGDTPREPPTGKAPHEITVVVDPGHGGKDTGALSPHGFEEKEANLLLAHELKKALAKRGFRVVMTREDDSFPALTDRPKVAHRENADAFISIHHNAPPYDRDPTNRYCAVYCWNDLGDRLARALDDRLGAALADEIPNNGVIRGNLAVTRNPEIPSCLVEVDFLTSPAGEEAVWNGRRRIRVAEALADGFADWTRGGPVAD